MSSDHPLLRFLDKARGPIVSLRTISHGSADSPLWYSMAELSPNIVGEFRTGDLLAFGGGGWDQSRQVSQEKALTEAVERWAFRYYAANNPEGAGLNIDDSSNGFAALPATFGADKALIHAAAEAIERYLIGIFWDKRSLPLETMGRQVQDLPVWTQNLYKNEHGAMHLYKCALRTPDQIFALSPSSKDMVFILALFYRKNGGVVPGSACGFDINSCVNRATLEAWNHLNALKSFESGSVKIGATITDQRLIWFGSNQGAAHEVKKAIDVSLKLPPSDDHKVAFELLTILDGPWQPEVRVARAIVKGSNPITLGDHKRFFI